MRRAHIIHAWSRILLGYRPVLSVEITKECPLSCPGCYAYQAEHVSGAPLLSVAEYKGNRLVEGVLTLIDEHRPLLVVLVGGEPLVRFRELNILIPKILERGVEVEVVTSAVRPVPREWSGLQGLRVIVSVDGLQAEHDHRRKPATYERILQHIEGHRILVHCTITSQMTRRDNYLEEFIHFWSEHAAVSKIRVSLFTPQVGEICTERLTPETREKVVSELERLLAFYPKLDLVPGMLKAFLKPPENPQSCAFARATLCISPDLKTVITPCQFGGNPNCSECGCAASAGFHAIGNYQLPGGMKLVSVLETSEWIGGNVRRVRERFS